MPNSDDPISPTRVTDPNSILTRWDITDAELTAIVDSNPSLRGMMMGYVAELKLTRLLEGNAKVSESMKYDDHDRTHKGDRVIVYKSYRFVLESKSLQTNSVRKDGDRWTAKAQVDASDRRTVVFPDGSKLNTTCLRVGEFDILAVNLFALEGKWDFVFAKNSDLPRSSWKRYKPKHRKQLLASLVPVTWPPEPPFYADLFPILEELVRDRSA